MFSALIKELETIQGVVLRIKSVNVNNREVKLAVIELGKRYFAEFHPKVTELGGDAEGVFAKHWQKLISLAHGNNSKKSYTSVLRTLRRFVSDLNVQALTAPRAATQQNGNSYFSDIEIALLKTLDQMTPTAGLSYRQAVSDLNSAEMRQSYRGVAAEFREVLREVLDHLAPDGSLTVQNWYKQEPGRSGPTMKQKVSFVLKSRDFGDTKRKPTEKSAEMIDTLCGDITRATYDRTSLSVHLQTTRDEVSRLRQYVLLVLTELLELN